MTLRAAVVGCGALANGAHLPNLHQNDLFELVVTCDNLESSAKAAAERWGAQRWCCDWHEVVNADDVDLIVLCTHTNLRADLICAAVENGKPVYTEKPLASSREEMMRIYQSCAKSGVSVCVGHNRRSSPAVLEFKRLLEKAEQGSDRRAIVDRSDAKKSRIAEEEQIQLLMRVNDDIRTWKGWIFSDDEGIIHAEMVHFIDLCLWLIPSVPVEVYACGSARGNFTEIIRFADGSMATLQHSLVGNFDYPKELFEATRRNVTIALDHHLEVRQRGLNDEPFRTCYPLASGHEFSDKPGIEAFHEACDVMQAIRERGEELPYAAAGPNKGHMSHLVRFGEHILGRGENPCPVDSAIVVTRIALRLLESVRLGIPVKVGPEDYDLVLC